MNGIVVRYLHARFLKSIEYGIRIAEVGISDRIPVIPICRELSDKQINYRILLYSQCHI
jgi:hypothetical protein